MEQTYKIEGMNCSSCLGKVIEALKSVEGLTVKKIGLNPSEAELSMNQDIEDSILDKAIKKAGNYSIRKI